jgi:LAGLIDADG DNA endonuclease family protein
MILPAGKVRVTGSGYSTFVWSGKPIAFLNSVEDSGQRAWSDKGQAYSFIQPLGARTPVEIATSRVLGGGTLQLTIQELWNQAVWEQMAGMAGTNNIVEIFDRLAANPNYVTAQTIIKPPGTEANPSKWRGKIYHNCFNGEVRYLTKQGVKTLAETAGTTQQVLSHRGFWTEAEIKSFGEQELLKLTVTRQGRAKEILVTAGHRWFVNKRTAIAKQGKSCSTEKTTVELQPGDRLTSTYATGRLDKVRPSAIGVQAGLVFGDGSVQNRASHVCLYGEKDAALLKYFPNSPTVAVTSAGGVSGIKVNDLPGYFKQAPPLDESLSYLYGWLAGYFAADGTVDKNGSVSLISSNKEHVELARQVCTLLGIRTYGITETEVKSSFKEGTVAYRMVINAESLREDFFLIPEHRDRFLQRAARPEKSMAAWKVVSVEETGRTEEVFCAVVPDGHAFVLEDNILTGNCTIVDIADGDTLTVGGLDVAKPVVCAYTHTTRLR